MYQHTWTHQPSHPAYHAAWPTILHDTRRIIGRLREAGMVIAGPDGLRCRACLHRAVDAGCDLVGVRWSDVGPVRRLRRIVH